MFAKFAHPDGSFEAHHATDKFWEKPEADAALAGTTSPGLVKEVSSRKNTRKPPTPLNTTAFTTDASSRLGITPAAAMRIAEDLYMDGFISYPRTDNTVYPPSLNTVELVDLAGADPRVLGRQGPARQAAPGDPGQEGDHRPPADLPDRRRFTRARSRARSSGSTSWSCAASSPPFPTPMITESTRADIEAGSEMYFVRGSVVVDPGYAAIYTYARSADEEIPRSTEGQSLDLDGEPWIVDKETQPPSRISQGKLIELMEERGLGTKATRADIIQKLYDRGYVFSNPPEPSETGIAMYKAFHEYVPRMATPEMTAELEADMDQIAAGEISKDEVVSDQPRDAALDHGRARGPPRGLREGDLGGDGRGQVPRPVQGLRGGRAQARGRLAEPAADHRPQGRQADVRLRGLEPRRPRVARLLPGQRPAARARLRALAARGALLGLRRAAAADGEEASAGRPWKLCLNDDCPTMVEMREKRAEREAAKEAREAAKEAAEADGERGGSRRGRGAGARKERGAAADRKKPAPTTARTKRARSKT